MKKEERMPRSRLSPDEVDFIMKLKEVKDSNCEIARKLGITEGAVRYQIKRRRSGAVDRRTQKPSMLDRYLSVIYQWKEDYKDGCRRPTLKALCKRLRERYGYQGSYDAFRRYIRKVVPEFFKKRFSIRVETPPGALMLVDWKEDIRVQMGEPGRWVKVQGFCSALGFSRKMVVRTSEYKTLDAFIHAHQETFRRIDGLPDVIRTDCLKSAVLRWRGSRSVLTERYRRYLDRLGIDAFPARPGEPEDKGKVEKRIRDLFGRLDFAHTVFRDMQHLQRRIDEETLICEGQWRCGATGLTVAESFAYEKDHLRALPDPFPQIPLDERRTSVRRDGTVFFRGNYYQVSGDYRDKSVLCVHTGEEIVIYHDGDEIGRFPYLPGTKGMVRLAGHVLEDPELHLSETVRRWGLEVADRQVAIYQEIIKGRSA
jgi:transposase